MWAWGMPSPFLFGLAAFLLNYVPYLGSVTGVIIAALIALFVYDDLFTPLMVGLTYLALTSLEGQLITPFFVSRRLQLSYGGGVPDRGALGMAVVGSGHDRRRAGPCGDPGAGRAHPRPEQVRQFPCRRGAPALEDEDEDEAPDPVPGKA